MTNTLTLTHTEAVKLHKELTIALEDKNLDTIQIVSTTSDIHVSRVMVERSDLSQVMENEH